MALLVEVVIWFLGISGASAVSLESIDWTVRNEALVQHCSVYLERFETPLVTPMSELATPVVLSGSHEVSSTTSEVSTNDTSVERNETQTSIISTSTSGPTNESDFFQNDTTSTTSHYPASTLPSLETTRNTSTIIILANASISALPPTAIGGTSSNDSTVTSLSSTSLALRTFPSSSLLTSSTTIATTTTVTTTTTSPCTAFRNHTVKESQFTFGHNGLKITGGCYKLAAFNDDLTAIKCMKRCLKIPGCRSISYTWLPPYNTNRCYLYDDLTQQSEGKCNTEVAFSRAAGDWETHDITRDCRKIRVKDCDSYTHIDDRRARLGPECGYPQTVYDYRLRQSCRRACSISSWCVAYNWSILVGTGTARKRCLLYPLNPRLYKGCELERVRRERNWLFYKNCEGLMGDDKTGGI